MVTVAEALGQISRAKTQLGESRSELAKRELEITQSEKRIGAAFFPGTIRTQLALGSQPGIGLGGVGPELKRRRGALKQRQTEAFGQIRLARAELVPIREQFAVRKQEIASFERTVRAQQQLLKDIALAKKLASKGTRGLNLAAQESRRVKEFTTEIRMGLRIGEQRLAQFRALKDLGLKPLFDQGTLTGFESETLQQTIPFTQSGLTGLGIQDPTALKGLEALGFVETSPGVTTTRTDPQFLDPISVPGLTISITEKRTGRKLKKPSGEIVGATLKRTSPTEEELTQRAILESGGELDIGGGVGLRRGGITVGGSSLFVDAKRFEFAPDDSNVSLSPVFGGTTTFPLFGNLFGGGGSVTSKTTDPSFLPAPIITGPGIFGSPVLSAASTVERSGSGALQSFASPSDLIGLGGASFTQAGAPLPSSLQSILPEQLPPDFRLRGGADIQDVQEQDKITFADRVRQFSLVGAQIGASQTPFIGVPGFGIKESESITEFRAGVTSGLIPKTPGELAFTAATFGAGTLIGGGLKLGGLGLKAIGGARALKVGEVVTGGIGVGLGADFLRTTFQETTGRSIDIKLPLFRTEFPNFKDVTATEAGGALGEAGRDVVAFGGGLKLGTKAFSTVSDLIATKAFTKKAFIEIPAESVIAPEFFEGQRFPKIRRGQTAGQLRQEFFQPELAIGETGKAPRFFTALSTEPLAALPRGDSFVFGGFGAPKGSPRFFRIGSSETPRDFFSFGGLLDVGKPTLARITFKDIGFAPGITARTRRPTGRVSRGLLEFFGGGFKEGTKVLRAEFAAPKAPKGEAFIPFVKTEKEAVGIVGTKVIETRRKFFFKFEGRRVVIPELTAVSEGQLGSGGKVDLKTLGDFLKDSSRIPRRSIVDPSFGGISLVSGTRIKSSSLGLPSSSDLSLTSRPSRRNPFSISSSGFSSSGSFIPSSRGTPISRRTPFIPSSTLLIPPRRPPTSPPRSPPRRPPRHLLIVSNYSILLIIHC